MTKEEMLEAAELGTMKCSVCGNTMDIFDIQEKFHFDRWIGYGSIHDTEHIKFDLCCDCFDRLFELIRPYLPDPCIVEYDLTTGEDIPNR